MPAGVKRFAGERELIVIARPEVAVRATREGVASAVGADITSLTEFLASEGVTLQPLLGVSEDRLKYEALSFTAATGVEVPDLSVYYRLQAPEERLDELATRISKLNVVEAAYVKPAAEPPQMLNDMLPAPEEAPPVTPDFTSRQGYLEAAPSGIDARFAWTLTGGGGKDIGIIDIEGAWRFTHEDLVQNQGGVIAGTQSTDLGWRNHGTAVIGEFGGDRNNLGITGISPESNVRAISIFGGTGSSGAIRQAADALSPGDIILIELHRPGPRYSFQGRLDQLGYIAIEWWPDDFDAIRYATTKGVIVVEAGGNGAENLDDPLYNVRPGGFPATWTNPFNRANRDSGSIVVGAGAPPPGTHGRDWGPDRSRLDFSNYGSIFDAQCWGREVTSCGYGDLQGGSNEDFWYTDRFSGTSSASPIVVGALACVQGVLRAQNKPLFTPASARNCLRTTGSPQQDAPGRPASQRIGNRPNIRQLITCAGGKLKEIKEVEVIEKILKEKGVVVEKLRAKESKDAKDAKEAKERKDTKEKDKDIKEKDIKDIVEGKRKELKEVKELKEKDKDVKDLRDVKTKEVREVVAPQPAEAFSVEERLARIEGAIIQLAHFIGIELRPELGESSLTQEPDLVAQSQQLRKQAADAKQAKDSKDIEKMSESRS